MSRTGIGVIVGIVIGVLAGIGFLFLGARCLRRSSTGSHRSPASEKERNQISASFLEAGTLNRIQIQASSSSRRLDRFRPPPISIPSPTLVVTPNLEGPYSASSNVSSLKVVRLEEGTSRDPQDEEEMLCEGEVVLGRRSLSTNSIGRNRSTLVTFNIQKPSVDYKDPRNSISAGFSTSIIPSGGRESPPRASFNRPTSSEIYRLGGMERGDDEISVHSEASLPPPPRSRSSRAVASSTVDLDSQGRRGRSGSLNSITPPVSHVLETFHGQKGEGESDPRVGLSKEVKISSYPQNRTSYPQAGTGDRPPLHPKPSLGVVSAGRSPKSSQQSTPSPQGSISIPFPPEVIEEKAPGLFKLKSPNARSRSHPRSASGKSPISIKSSAVLSVASILHSQSAPTSRRGSDLPINEENELGRNENIGPLEGRHNQAHQDSLPSPLYGRYDPRRSVWSTDTGSESSKSGSGRSETQSSRSSRRATTPLRPSSRRLLSTRDSRSSTSLESSIQRANAWAQAFDEEQRRLEDAFNSLSPHPD